ELRQAKGPSLLSPAGGSTSISPPCSNWIHPQETEARKHGNHVRQHGSHPLRPHPSHSASVVTGTSTSARPRPSRANLRQEISTPIAVSLWCHSRVASDPHGVMIGARFTPMSRAPSRRGVSVNAERLR